ncbi:MAG: diguanylate cyclase/phosphodiesterase & domain with sensor(s) [Actinomycetia bacterium]|nr:diguanylate cyclase/phosphodiesterase & domain with sensor(s) [Actinomycetes bacterium]
MNPEVVQRPVILVVEDHADIRDLLRLQLEFDGYDVLESETGELALDLLRAHHVDLAILDAELPGMSGYDVLTTLARDLPSINVPVLFLSGRTSTDDIVEAFRLGAHDHIAKPFRGKELRARVAAAIQLKRRHDELRQENVKLDSASRTDVLTGLANRRKLEADIDALTGMARRHDQPFSVALVDVDHFKLVNDTYGHSVGDEVLCTIAARLQEALRVEDVAGRWGGEEFLFLLPMTDLPGARVVGERLRQAVAREPVRITDGTLIEVSISVGVATGTDVPEVLLRADGALYRAKAGGRNLVTA